LSHTTVIAAAAADVAAGPLIWGGLFLFLVLMIVIDLKVGSARHGMTVRNAAVWSIVWVVLALGFGALLWLTAGGAVGETYFAGYVMERALSLDNVFVFTLIFAALAVPRDEQPRLLMYGIIAALALRGVLIVAGAEALERFGWVAWPFAALLAYTGWKTLRARHGAGGDDEGAKIVARVRRRLPGLRPAVLALVAVAFADILFAVDSVPAILAITTDTFVVFAANAFALLGLCALFFLVAGLVERFAYLQAGLGVLLIAIAGKLAYGELSGEKIPTAVTLAVIGGVLAIAVVASLLKERRGGAAQPQLQEG
jgi:predicted tellurium resistance membrane protein TerC